MNYLLDNGHINVVACIEAAVLDKALSAEAEVEWRSVAADLLSRNDERTGLRTSDAGGCVLSVWATIHDELDIPDSPKGLLRMANGKLMGALLACYAVAGMRKLYPHLSCVVEPKVMHDGIPGSVDLLARLALDLEPVETVEFKWVASTFARNECKDSYRLQSGKYALGAAAPRHQVVVYYAALPDSARGKWIGDVPVLWPHFFQTEETRLEVEADFIRLQPATDSIEPEPDAREDWMCRYCHYSGCERNVNPLAAQEVLA